MTQNRILAACILGLFVILLARIIWWQQGKVEDCDSCKETLAKIMDENNALKARVVELSEHCGDGGVDGGGR